MTASQLLYAHVQAVWIAGLAEVSYAALVAWTFPEARRRLPALAAFKALGCLGGAAQLVPLWDSFRESSRLQASRTYVAMGSVPPWNLIQWVAPYLTSAGAVIPPMATDWGVVPAVSSRFVDWRVHEFTMYLGSAVPVLAAWLVAEGRRDLSRGGKALAAASLALGGCALVLAFGEFTPLFELTRRVPVVGGFRVPGRYLTLVQLAAAVLSALAYTSLAAASTRGGPTPWRRLWPLAVPPALALLACLVGRVPGALSPWYLQGEFLAPAGWAAVGPLLVTSSAVLVALAARGSRGALLALPLLMAGDLGAYGFRAATTTPPRTLAEYRAARPVPPEVPPGSRVAFDTLHVIDQDPYTLSGLRTVDGYVSLPPRRNLSYRTPTSLRLAGVEWVLTGDASSPWRRLDGASAARPARDEDRPHARDRADHPDGGRDDHGDRDAARPSAARRPTGVGPDRWRPAGLGRRPGRRPGIAVPRGLRAVPPRLARHGGRPPLQAPARLRRLHGLRRPRRDPHRPPPVPADERGGGFGSRSGRWP